MATTQAAFLRECFAFTDIRQRGVLNLPELKCAVAAALGIRASKLALVQMFSSVLLDNDHTIEEIQVPEDVFVSVLLPRIQKMDLLEQVRRCFKAFDLRSQGFISFVSFAHAAASVLPHMSQRAIFEIFREADRDGDGRVTYNDFEAIYLIGEHAHHQQPLPPHTHTTLSSHHLTKAVMTTPGKHRHFATSRPHLK